jgi:hypothetical protein
MQGGLTVACPVTVLFLPRYSKSSSSFLTLRARLLGLYRPAQGRRPMHLCAAWPQQNADRTEESEELAGQPGRGLSSNLFIVPGLGFRTASGLRGGYRVVVEGLERGVVQQGQEQRRCACCMNVCAKMLRRRGFQKRKEKDTGEILARCCSSFVAQQEVDSRPCRFPSNRCPPCHIC